ncbi:MAG: glutaminyl-peptide cyclotransferase [Pseudomonadota bacterium]
MRQLNNLTYIHYGLILLTALGLMILSSQWNSSPFGDYKINKFTYKVINSYPHDPLAYTQGLVYHNGSLYESTGIKGQSSIRKINLPTGAVTKIKRLKNKYFGEGITILFDQIVQLTYSSKIGFVYDINSFEQVAQFHYLTQGWGITYDGTRIIVSDGSSKLYFYHPLTFKPMGFVEIFDNKGKVDKLNELEFIEGRVFANIFQADQIVQIDPVQGKVIASIDLSGLLTATEKKSASVLNGIAYNKEKKQLFVTGKNWPKLFEIELVESI